MHNKTDGYSFRREITSDDERKGTAVSPGVSLEKMEVWRREVITNSGGLESVFICLTRLARHFVREDRKSAWIPG